MKVAVVGAGETGFHIAQSLSNEGHSVVVIDTQEETLEHVRNSLDVLAILGDGSSHRILEEAGVKGSDFFAAVTNNDRVNIIAALLAKTYQVPRAVVRISDPQQLDNPVLLKETGLYAVYPEKVVADKIAQLIEVPFASLSEIFAEGRVQMLKLEVKKGAALEGKRLSELQRLSSWILVALSRGGELTIPRGDTLIQAGDYVIGLGIKEALKELEELVGPSEPRTKRVVILGGGKIGYYLLKELSGRGISLRLIETSPQRSLELAQELSNVLVFKGDGTSGEVLREAGIEDADYFVALTRDDEINILASLCAKNLGCKKVVILSRKMDYTPIVQRVGIDVAISPPLAAASEIMRHIRAERVLSLSLLEGGKGEILEVMVKETSRIAGKPLRDTPFPEGALIAAVVRDRKIIIPRGDTIVAPNDRVIVFMLPEATKKVERLFG
ncbi:MAG: Trk system potassium transporter TrkA [Candidatus Aerophobetes bacterium]